MTKTEWQPIRTAPKQTRVLIFTKDECICIASLERLGLREYWTWVMDNDTAAMSDPPMHWQSLPEPPK